MGLVSSETIPDKVEFCENPKLKSINAIINLFFSLVNSLFHGLNYLFNFFWLKSTLIHLIKILTKTFSNVPKRYRLKYLVFFTIFTLRETT
jgi:hypothetical protein